MDYSTRIVESLLHSLKDRQGANLAFNNIQRERRHTLQLEVNGEQYLLMVAKKNPTNADQLMSMALRYAAYRDKDQSITPDNFPDDLEPYTKYYTGNGTEEFYLEVGRNSSHYFYAKTDNQDRIWVLSWEPDTDTYETYQVNSFQEAYLGHY